MQRLQKQLPVQYNMHRQNSHGLHHSVFFNGQIMRTPFLQAESLLLACCCACLQVRLFIENIKGPVGLLKDFEGKSDVLSSGMKAVCRLLVDRSSLLNAGVCQSDKPTPRGRDMTFAEEAPSWGSKGV